MDGERFDVRRRPGGYDVIWLSGPNEGYGFSIVSPDGRSIGPAAIEASIRDFLAQVNPDTGFID